MKSKSSFTWAQAFSLFLVAGIALAGFGCSSARTKKNTPELSRLAGKKIALVEVDGEPTVRTIVEVALVNQILQKGTFILVPKQDVEAAKVAVGQSPLDWKGIAKRAGADDALRVRVLNFDAITHSGYSEEEVEDSQLAEEEGVSEAKTEDVYKVKSLTGHVRFDLEFTDLQTGETSDATAEATDKVVSSAKDSAIHLPPKMGFLEKLSNQAFKRFFDQYQ